jgi:hypothetical protein
LINNKHIPDSYKYNSRENRLQLLAGLIDSDGYMGSNVYEITQKRKNLSDDIMYLCRSLGYACYQKECIKSCTYKGKRVEGTYYKLSISGDLSEVPVKINRKKATKRKQIKDVLVTGFKVQYSKKDNYYGITIDGNQRFLLGDFTVTHNSCAAISIAEQFKEHMRKYNKKTLVILKKNIQKGFKQQIYDLSKELAKTKPDDVVQCTGSTYTLPPEDRHLTLAQKERKISAMIRRNYQFVGYEQFANEVKRKTDWDGEIKNLTPEIIKKIDREYSNRVIVIDEVHHIKSTIEKKEEIKKVPPILTAIVKYSKNVRLVLMSATPMYDKPQEIVYLLNLLLLNDKREPIKISDVFDSRGHVKKGGEKILKEASRGYISYLRGENPITFPIRLYPTEAKTPKIKYDIYGDKISPTDELKYLKLVLDPMSDNQYKWYKKTLQGTSNKELSESENEYNKTLNNTNNNTNNNNNKNNNNKNNNNKNNNNNNNNKNKNNNNNNNNNVVEKTENKSPGFFNLVYVSNIVYPTKQGGVVYGGEGITTSDDGNGAFYKVSTMTQGRKRVSYKYQNHVIFNKGTIDERPFLDRKYFPQYSSKFANALEHAINSKGIVFIYTRYLPGGIIPFALALEQNGVQRYEVDGDRQLLDYKPNNRGGGGKTTPICFYCGKFASDSIHKPANPNYHKFYFARYMALTGSKELTKVDIRKATNIINAPNNQYGEEVKIILGNEAVSEGIDFHRIRQIHVLEPWYNISLLEQIIGRGIRNCSHKTLPIEERNVEIFLHASTPSNKASVRDKETETVDIRGYRISENKDVKIKDVERILKENSIDCLLNKNANVYLTDKEIPITTASGRKMRYKLGDKPYTRECDYKSKCDYKCTWEPKEGEKIIINEDTYSLVFAKSDIDLAKKYIKLLYRKNIIYDLPFIIKELKKKIPHIENKYIFKALDEIVRNKNEIVYDKFNREGYLIYKGKYYIFQPKEITDETIPLHYRDIPIDSKTKSLAISEYSKKLEEKKEAMEENKDILGLIEKNIEKYDRILAKTIKINGISLEESLIAVLGMVLDRLPENDIISILKSVIVKHNKGRLDNKLEKAILVYYIDNIFLESLVTDPKKKLASEIYGFRFHNKYYCQKNNVWSICSDIVRKKIEAVDKILAKRERKDNLIMGLMAYNKKKEPIFQIIDKEKYKAALTLADKKSKRVEVTGRVCSTFNIDILIKIRTVLRMKNASDRSKKNVLCDEIEFMFRLRDNEDKMKKWFQNNIKK